MRRRGALVRRAWMSLALVLGLAVAVGSAAGDSDLVGVWHLDQIDPGMAMAPPTTPDSSGNGLTGRNVAATLESGRFGNALKFTNTGDGVDVADDPALRPDRMTVMAWVKQNGNPLRYRTLVGKGADLCSDRSYLLDTGSSPGGLRFVVRLVKSSGDSFVADYVVTEVPSPGIWDGQWHAVAGTYDGATARLWVDGVEVRSAPVPAGFTTVYYPSTGDPRLSFGRYVQPGAGCDQSGFQYQGAIDEVRIYKRALSATELNYLQTAGATPPELPPPTTTGTTTTGTTTQSTTTTGPGGGPGGPVAHFLVGQSLKLKGAVRFSGLSSLATAGEHIVDYHWVLNGLDGTVDVDCGHSPVMSHPFGKGGAYQVTLTVTDSKGQRSTFADQVPVPLRGKDIPQLADLSTFDCENPAKGEQPSTNDCVKSFGFGIVDVNSRGRPSDCFDITGLGHKILKRLYRNYHAKIGGPVVINGLYIPIPEGVKTEYDSATDSVAVDGASRISIRIGPFLTQKIDLNLKVVPNRQAIFHVFDVDKAINTPEFLGSLPVRGAFAVDLIYHASTVKVGVGLPSSLSFGGKKAAQGDAYLISDNVNGVHYDGLSVLVPDVWLGPIFVSSLSFKYIKSENLWQGGARITLPGSTFAINAAGPPTQPPDFGFGLKNGRFDHAGFGVDFSPPTQPDLFFPFHTVLLSHIGAAVGLNPLRLTGTIGISADDVVDEDGVLFGAFATSSTPYDLPENVGPELAPIAGRRLDSFTLAIGGTATLKVPVLGALPLFNAYGLYEYPDYFEFGGAFSFGVSFLKLDGGVSGFVYPSNRTFNIEAGLRACLRGITIGYKGFGVTISPCLNVGGVISSQGLGFCAVLPVPFPIVGTIVVPIGAGYRWGDSTPDLMLFSCDYAPYRQVSPRAARDAAAVARYSIALPAGLPAAMLRIRGQGAAPSVTVTDPRGRDIAGSGDAMTLQGADANATLVALRHPAAGQWTVTAKPDSAPIVSVESANGLPSVAVKARVSGRGLRRVLAYRLTPAAGRTVTFAERGPRTVHIIGVARGRSGRISFMPGRGRGGRRSIIAIVTQAGGPSKDLVVASYTAPAAGAPARPGHLRASRRSRSISVSWDRVPGAARYEVLVVLADGSETFRVVRATHATVPDPFTRKRGKVLVDALAVDGSRGAASTAGLR